MKQRSVDLYTVAFNTMSDACANCNAMHRASSLVIEMRQSAVELVVITHSTLVKGICREGHADRSLRVVVEMKSHESFASDEVIYRQRRCGVAPFSLLLRAAETLSNAECECVGECRLWPRNVSEARVAPACRPRDLRHK